MATYGGFFGKYSLGAVYRWREKNNFEMSLGLYSIGEKDFHQVNLAYRRSIWLLLWDEHHFSPVQLGFFVVTAIDNDSYFYTSPSKYPDKGYYDQTAYRYGLEYSTSYAYHQYEFSYYLRVMDTGIIALYNNAHRDLQYYLSSGLSAAYRF